MSALTLVVLAVPLVWIASIWAINRFAVHNLLQKAIRMVFGLSALSPLLILLIYVIVEGMNRGRPLSGLSDPKVWAVLFAIGLPATLVATGLAYWGCRGRLSEQ
jgi:hypothetical protein